MARRVITGRIAVAAVAAALAAASAGCGRDDEIGKRGAPRPLPTATTQTQTRTQTRPATVRTHTTATRRRTTTSGSSRASAMADTRARNTAVRYARGRFGVSTLAHDVTLRRSRRNPRWVMASAADGRTLWVVWLRDGAVALATTDRTRFDPPSVPCDVRPAFLPSKC